MAYSNKVVDHYENPRNVGSLPKDDVNVGTGLVGAPECGDVMKLQVKVNPETGVIDDAKFKTFGCGSAIASSSLATEWLKGKTVDQALAIKNTEIVAELSLPPVKIHCSVLAEDAIKAAIADYKKKQGATAEQNADTKTTIADALLGHQRPDLPSGAFADLNHLASIWTPDPGSRIPEFTRSVARARRPASRPSPRPASSCSRKSPP